MKANQNKAKSDICLENVAAKNENGQKWIWRKMWIQQKWKLK